MTLSWAFTLFSTYNALCKWYTVPQHWRCHFNTKTFTFTSVILIFPDSSQHPPLSYLISAQFLRPCVLMIIFTLSYLHIKKNHNLFIIVKDGGFLQNNNKKCKSYKCSILTFSFLSILLPVYICSSIHVFLYNYLYVKVPITVTIKRTFFISFFYFAAVDVMLHAHIFGGTVKIAISPLNFSVIMWLRSSKNSKTESLFHIKTYIKERQGLTFFSSHIPANFT